MNKLLTTGEMIDVLKVGEVAIGDITEIGVKVKIIKDKTGHIKLFGTKHVLEMTAGIVDSVKWHILTNYVSFEEAMKALKEGSRIKWFSPDGADSLIFVPEEYEEDFIDMSFKDILEGQWTIEEEIK